MTAFQKAEALAGQRYDRDKLLSMVDEWSQRISVCRTGEIEVHAGWLAGTWPMLLIAAADQPCNSAGMISRRGFGRSGRLESIVRWSLLDLGCTRPNIRADDRSESGHVWPDVRVNQWIAHLPEDHPLAQQHRALLGATASITWTSSFNRHLAVCNGLRILLARGYDSLHHIKDDDLKLLSVRWSKGTDALDAALCSLGVFSRTPKRGSARHGRKQRMTAPELVENAGVPDRFQQVVILYLETYEARVSDVYRTLRHKVIALAHFWRFIRDKHPDV